jgi:spectinomycin phosphotransferase
MMNRHLPSDQYIIDCLRGSYGIEVQSITPLSGGADMNATIYKIQASDTSSFFAKLKLRCENDMSVSILELLHSSGIQQVIPPIKTIDGHSILRTDDVCVIVYPFIEGVNGFTHSLTDQQWITLGKALRQVHDLDVPSSLLEHIRQETYSPKWRQTVRSLYTHIQSNPPSNDAISLRFLNFMKDHKLVIQRLVDRAEQLCDNIKEHPTKFVLCHSDIHGGNVLLSGSNAIYIVDWDEPIMAPKERDLMFIGGSIGNVWNKPHEEQLFYKGYGETEVDLTILAYYRHERIVEDIAIYSQELLLTAAGGEDRPIMYQHFIDMFAPNGVVEIAFKTDENASF